MMAVAWFQALLDGLGAILAFIYNVVPNYGIAIILLTLAIRVVLLPLAIKQVRSMQAMQAIQPKVKALQQKYKGNRQKLNEELPKLYREHGVNPFMGCLPLVAQFPVLIALFAVLQFPKGLTHIPHSDSSSAVGQPQDSRLYVDIVNQKTKFLGANLVCTAAQAGRQETVDPKKVGVPDAPRRLDCGSGAPVRIPYYVFAVAMIATTYYQQKQLQRASPAASQQQQAITRFMPLLFGFWGFVFPAGLVIYWTTTNAVQIAQQHFMLPKPAEEPTGARSAGDGGRKVTGPTLRRFFGLIQPQKPPASRRGQGTGRGLPKEGTRKEDPSTGGGEKPRLRGEMGRPTGGRDARGRKKRRKR